MTQPFTITAWDTDGKGIVRIQGPIPLCALYHSPSVGEDGIMVPWTDPEDEFLIKFSGRVPMKIIAAKLPGRTLDACYDRKKRLKKRAAAHG